MNCSPEFSADYADARRKFVRGCVEAGVAFRSYRNPGAGPAGEILYTDCAVLGTAAASRVLIVNTAIHGVEGFCGSAALIGWLRSGFYRRLPADTKVVLIHALNPYGFAWLRRVNEDNVDLNRNFLGADDARPANVEYDRLHTDFLPADWGNGTESMIRGKLEEAALRHGLMRMQSLVCKGQYRWAEGVFFGGEGPTWSHRLFMDIVGENTAGARRVVLVDFHTGLGEFGEPELICAVPPDRRIRAWFSDRVTSARLGNAIGPGLNGTIGQGLRRAVPEADVYSITAEFGTFDIYRVLMAIVADNWLHVRGDPAGKVASAIKKEMRSCFFPDTDAWRRKVHAASQRILTQALAGIAGE